MPGNHCGDFCIRTRSNVRQHTDTHTQDKIPMDNIFETNSSSNTTLQLAEFLSRKKNHTILHSNTYRCYYNTQCKASACRAAARALPPRGFPLELGGRRSSVVLLVSTHVLAASSRFPLHPDEDRLRSSLGPFHLQVLSCRQSFVTI